MIKTSPDRQTKPKNICLFAFIGSDNIGDEAIFLSIAADILSLKNLGMLNILSTNPQKTNQLLKAVGLNTGFKVFDTKDYKGIFNESDLVVCGGGGIFQDETSIYNPWHFTKRINYATKHKIPVIVYGISAGPLKYHLSKAIVSKALNRTKIITVRDDSSKKLLKKIGVSDHKVIVTADPAINLISHKLKIATNKIPDFNTEKKICVVCLRHWFEAVPFLPVSIVRRFKKDFNKKSLPLYQEIAKSLDKISSKYQIIFLPMWPGRDDLVHNKVRSLMGTKDSAIIEGALNPLEFATVILKSDLVIGMRLHALILAAAASVPFIALDYSVKIQGFVNRVLALKFKKTILVDINDIKTLDFAEKVAGIDKNKEELLLALKRGTSKFKNSEKENIKIIKEILDEI